MGRNGGLHQQGHGQSSQSANFWKIAKMALCNPCIQLKFFGHLDPDSSSVFWIPSFLLLWTDLILIWGKAAPQSWSNFHDDSDLLFKPALQTLHLNGFFSSWTDPICSFKFTCWGKTYVANVTLEWLLSVMSCFNMHIQRLMYDFVLIYSNWRKQF